MARSSEEYLLAWAALSSNQVECQDDCWQVIFLSPAGPVEIEAGLKSPENCEAIIFSFSSARIALNEKLPEGKGFLVERTESLDKDGIRLALTRKSDGNLELFTAMVCDVVGALDLAASRNFSQTVLLQTLIKRILTWQSFMLRSTNPLGPEAELGLAGELYFLKALIISPLPPSLVLSGWVGPEGAPQDFLLGMGAIEVKATLSSSGFPAKIGSLEQLDDAFVSPIFLAAIKFSSNDNGITLPEMVIDLEHYLINEPELIIQFRERLLLAGYISSHSDKYTRRFEAKEQRFLIVENSFPRLTTGSVPCGVVRASYEINLDHANCDLIGMDMMLKRLGVAA
ncbi:MAG: PD-(D/E)XK motif protein [Chromatiaceae bacterium]|nr:PD-(D/E)XK motif protein [Chromatiaceae bacterium]